MKLLHPCNIARHYNKSGKLERVSNFQLIYFHNKNQLNSLISLVLWMEIDSEIKLFKKISNSYSRSELLNSICLMMLILINITPIQGIITIQLFLKIKMKKIRSMRNIKKVLLRKTNIAFKQTNIGKIHKIIIAIIMIIYKIWMKIAVMRKSY